MNIYGHGFFMPHVFRNRFHYTPKDKSLVNQTLTIHRNRYHIEQELSHGAFGIVHAGRRLSDGKPVAVKVFPLAYKDQRQADMLGKSFLNEVHKTRKLSIHSNHIAHIYDFDFDWKGGWCYFVMDLAQHDFGKTLQSRGALPHAETKMYWRQLVDMGVTLHNSQIAHLDIKPPNILVFPGNLLKLADLGIAKRAHDARVGRTGTRPYSAPEVTMIPRHQMVLTSRKSDSWSWGAILYQMTYGRQPNDNIAPYSDQPPFFQHPTPDRQLQNVLHHTLAHDPAQRFSAVELADHPYTRSS